MRVSTITALASLFATGLTLATGSAHADTPKVNKVARTEGWTEIYGPRPTPQDLDSNLIALEKRGEYSAPRPTPQAADSERIPLEKRGEYSAPRPTPQAADSERIPLEKRQYDPVRPTPLGADTKTIPLEKRQPDAANEGKVAIAFKA